MSLLRLAWKNITGNGLRSWVVALCALVVASLALSSTLLLGGAATSLEQAAGRLGADIVVVPDGAETEADGALLMGVPAEALMPADTVLKLAAIPGVAAVSPQIYLDRLEDAACCSAPEMHVVAYDPDTDFAVAPWLETRLAGGLGPLEVIGGALISATEGEDGILVYGTLLRLKGHLEPTGTSLDQTLFVTLETAREMAKVSAAGAVESLRIPAGQVSAVLVQLEPGAGTEAVAVEIFRTVPGVYPIMSANLFASSRAQLGSLVDSVLLLTALIWPLAALLIGMVCMMAADERRRELGVLRALGATSRYVARSLLLEAGLLAACGAVLGALLSGLGITLFRSVIVRALGVPFLMPPPGTLALQIGMGLALAMVSVLLAALWPAIKVSRQDPAIAMRE